MCGIAGQVGTSWSDDTFPALLAAIEHRGPDGSGSATYGQMKLGMTRLRIRGANVPLPVAFKNGVVAFNGQIYGFWGNDGRYTTVDEGIGIEVATVEKVAQHADGMYACALCDANGNSVILKTDPHFIKPIFYRQSEHGVVFCSEFRPLLCVHESNAINTIALAELFVYGWYLGEHSFINDTYVAWKHDVCFYEGYGEFKPKPSITPIASQNDLRVSLRQAIGQSVRRCLHGTGPYGLALSGGLDSSILAWELNAAGVENLVTISVREGEDGISSLSELGLPPGGAWETWQHRVVTIATDDEYLLRFRASTIAFGQPSTMSSLPLYHCLADAAADEGVRILITGEGLDEYFCGYSSYSKLRGLPSPVAYYHHPRRYELACRLFGRKAIESIRQHFFDIYGAVRDIRWIERELRLTRLLIRTDVCLMARSIEGRVPYLHNHIPEIALGIPWQELIGRMGKQILREAYHELLGARAWVRKARFKTSDVQLLRCLQHRSIVGPLRSTVERYFGATAAAECLSSTSNNEMFDADVATLLLTLTFLDAEGYINANAA